MLALANRCVSPPPAFGFLGLDWSAAPLLFIRAQVLGGVVGVPYINAIFSMRKIMEVFLQQKVTSRQYKFTVTINNHGYQCSQTIIGSFSFPTLSHYSRAESDSTVIDAETRRGGVLGETRGWPLSDSCFLFRRFQHRVECECEE
jgi:hypothetical protein